MNAILNLRSVVSATMRLLVAAGSALGAPMVPAQTDGYDVDYALIADSSLPAGTDWQLEGIQKRVLEVIKKVSPATVRIAWGKNDGQGLLSGTIVTANGHVATRGQHGLAAGKPVVFYLADGRRATGEVLGACWGFDIGLMKITERGAWPHVELGKSGEAKAGDLCLAMGYPILDRGLSPPSFAQEPSPRAGRILTSAAPLWFSISCPLDTAEEGGGLFDLHGRLIGVSARSLGLGSLNRRDRAGAICAGVELFQKHWDELAAGKQIDGLPWSASKSSAGGTVLPSSAPPVDDPSVVSALKMVQPATIRFGTGTNETDYISGVIVSADGYIVTVAHHDRPAGQDVTVCLPDGRNVAGQVLGSNPLSDVGLVKITEKGRWPHADLGNSIALKRGDPGILLGYPYLEFPGGLWDTNRQPAIRTGVVVDTGKMGGRFESSCRMSPGFSGGGLFDLAGRLVGVQEGGDRERGTARHGRVELVRMQWDFLATGKPHETVATAAPDPIVERLRTFFQVRPWKN